MIYKKKNAWCSSFKHCKCVCCHVECACSRPLWDEGTLDVYSIQQVHDSRLIIHSRSIWNVLGQILFTCTTIWLCTRAIININPPMSPILVTMSLNVVCVVSLTWSFCIEVLACFVFCHLFSAMHQM